MRPLGSSHLHPPRPLVRTSTNTMAKRKRPRVMQNDRRRAKAPQSRATAKKPAAVAATAKKPAAVAGLGETPRPGQFEETMRRAAQCVGPRRPPWQTPDVFGPFPSAAAWKACLGVLSKPFEEICRAPPNCFCLIRMVECSQIVYGQAHVKAEADVNWYTGGDCTVTMPAAVNTVRPGVYLVKRKITQLWMHGEDFEPGGDRYRVSITHLRLLGSTIAFLQMAYANKLKLGRVVYCNLMEMLGERWPLYYVQPPRMAQSSTSASDAGSAVAGPDPALGWYLAGTGPSRGPHPTDPRGYIHSPP